jgi:hypothetical protein
MGRTARPTLPYRPPRSGRHHYVFIKRCGCLIGLVEASARKSDGPPRLADEGAAWSEMYQTRREEQAARAQGITVVHVDHAEYEREFFPKMTERCTH